MNESLNQPLIPVLTIIGTGLIGGSFAAALRRVGQVNRIIGVGRNQDSLQTAKKLGLIDEFMDLEKAVQQSDVIMLATPIGAMHGLLQQMKHVLPADTLLTDAGSTKMDVAEIAEQALEKKYLQFIPGHPIAGSEMVGPEAADAMLYHGRKVVLTPYKETSGTRLHYLIRIWEACGARVQLMEPAAHDRALASVSHLPHLLAAAYMSQVIRADDSDSRLNLAGTGFKDFTRIAAGSPEVWRDIFSSNRTAVLQELNEFNLVLAEFKTALENQDYALLEKILEQAAIARRFWGGRSQT